MCILSVQENVDPERIGIIGICGWGGMALQTACIDTRIKATVTSTLYDMSRVAGNGYFDSEDNEEARHRMRGEGHGDVIAAVLRLIYSHAVNREHSTDGHAGVSRASSKNRVPRLLLNPRRLLNCEKS